MTLARPVRPWYVSSETGKRLPIRQAPRVMRRRDGAAFARLSSAVLRRIWRCARLAGWFGGGRGTGSAQEPGRRARRRDGAAAAAGRGGVRAAERCGAVGRYGRAAERCGRAAKRAAGGAIGGRMRVVPLWR